ncbi:TM2 domain-containing protein almondex [Orchesella cincta]|uniref:TM2 domain-containing protein almondex n=1 Tax=Orchesella cincta TaxID=48709 RepID=A0A1D2N333_ORCCI|nr:TM2 domain-containing protein almondex [Orchesella cincta]
MQKVIISGRLVLVSILCVIWLNAFTNGDPDPKESSKVRQVPKMIVETSILRKPKVDQVDDDTKIDDHPTKSPSPVPPILKQTKSQTVKIDSHSYGVGRSPCLNNHELNCSDLEAECIECNFNEKCTYGGNVTVVCRKKSDVVCKGDSPFTREMVCQYCYQTPLYQQICNGAHGCNSINAPRQVFKHNCTVISSVLCLGNRNFYRMMPCNWKNGYRWSTSFILSVTLGGFGADRFYLGRWQEGIGKLFSFGGLGLWTIIDIILIGVRYLGPADGSLFVD